MALTAIGFGWEGYQNYNSQDPDAGIPGIGTGGTGKPGTVGDAEKTGATDDQKVKPGYRSSPAECKTCKERKYQDGSDENVSFKAAAHISPEAAPAAVRGHEGEHVSNAYVKAAQGGGKVLRASVTIHTAICPECGRTYVSGGTTETVIAYPKDDSRSSRGGRENFNIA